MFFVMYHFDQTHDKMHDNINTHVHIRKKNHVVCRFHYQLPLMCETISLKPFQINGNDPFSQQYLQTQINKIFRYLKDLKQNNDIQIFSMIYLMHLNSLNFNEYIYII
jgi:hypothetical protein